MAAGKPVVISDGANAAAVVDHGATGWVVPTGDTAALAETLRQVIDLPDTALAAMAGACQEQAAKYSIANLVERYSGLYRSLRCP
jgi:glycosyltransferase involved in cell wall biosynthesis